MPKWIKFIIAVLLLPVCAGAAKALWLVLRAGGGADTTWVPLLGGAACWVVIFIFLPKPMWIYVLGHELTHALWTWLFGGEVKKMKVSSKGGHVVISKTNFLIALAPYFFPLYAVIVIGVFALGNLIWNWHGYLLWFHLCVGAAYAFHVTLTFHTLQTRQTGHHEPGLFVFRRGDFSGQRLRAAVRPSAADAAAGNFQNLQPVVFRNGKSFRLAASSVLKRQKLFIIQS